MLEKSRVKSVWNTILKKYLLRLKIVQFNYGKCLNIAWNEKFIPCEDEMFLLKYFLKSNAIVFDIGANVGEFSHFLSTIVKDGKIYSFEPQKMVFNILRGSLVKIRNVHLYNLALSNHAGNSTIYIPIIKGHLSSCEASLDLHFNDYSGYERIKKSEEYISKKIKLATLDDFCDTNEINRIDFIKCDTEGHELEVLQGSEKCISKFRPILLIEIFPYVHEGHFEEVCNHLKEYRYVGYVISDNKNGVSELNRETLKNSRGFNYFFIPEEREIDFLNCFEVNF